MPLRIDQFLTNPRRNLSSSSSSSDSAAADDGGDFNPSILVISLILGVCLLSAIIHFLLRYITRRYKSANQNQEQRGVDVDDDDVMEEAPPPLSLNQLSGRLDQNQKLIESLPLFSFESVTGLKKSGSAAADCAVCLSKFERHDQLRLLPICCHAFHSDCIDMWLSSNTTCPLCRSTVNVAKSEDYMKLFGAADSSSRSSSSFHGGGGGESFRIEIGSVSRRRLEESNDDDRQQQRPRSYSMGSFEYVVDDESAEIVVNLPPPLPPRGGGVGEKDEVERSMASATQPNPPGSEIAGEVGEGRGWLRDYVDKLASSSSSSLSRSFRFSGRFFTGSGRRSVDIASGNSRGGSWDLEGNRYGEEISNFFRWLSGV